MAGEDDRAEGTWDKAKGSVKEAAGKATNDEDLEAEARWTRPRVASRRPLGKAKDGAEDVKESVKDASPEGSRPRSRSERAGF